MLGQSKELKHGSEIPPGHKIVFGEGPQHGLLQPRNPKCVPQNTFATYANHRDGSENTFTTHTNHRDGSENTFATHTNHRDGPQNTFAKHTNHRDGPQNTFAKHTNHPDGLYMWRMHQIWPITCHFTVRVDYFRGIKMSDPRAAPLPRPFAFEVPMRRQLRKEWPGLSAANKGER